MPRFGARVRVNQHGALKYRGWRLSAQSASLKHPHPTQSKSAGAVCAKNRNRRGAVDAHALLVASGDSYTLRQARRVRHGVSCVCDELEDDEELWTRSLVRRFWGLVHTEYVRHNIFGGG